ncbi:MAG: biotin--[acetyl-CoA-carboxylase] ligase [Lachnospiraceae bacterium]|nr:biotin--[acetyl-CoA-carboxylase] ligase [Lachnospiraceae bacterium]
MKTEIITLLRQRGTYVSGQELCEKFGVSRTAVWKAVEQLKKDGYVIEAVKNRGYLLKEDAARVFGRTEIESRLHTEWAGKTLYYFESTDSTNIRAKQLAEEGAPHGTLVTADCQTAGRGRRGRSWSSPAGANLYFTILLRPDILPDKASVLTLVMALAVAQGIINTVGTKEEETAGKGGNTDVKAEHCGVGIKWPNDIVADGRKVCGILTEMSLSVEQASIQYLVVGVGINVGKQSFPEELAGHAVSLEEIYGPVSRSRLLSEIMKAFEAAYGKFTETENLELLKEQYGELLLNVNRKVRVLDPKGEFEGIARGIRDTGELMVELPDGSITDVYAGEVSVRGIYGYV